MRAADIWPHRTGVCMQRGQAALLLPLLLICSRVGRASYLLTHTNIRPITSLSPDLCVHPELELQRMKPTNLTQHVRTPLESVRAQLAEDTKGTLRLASSRRSMHAVSKLSAAVQCSETCNAGGRLPTEECTAQVGGLLPLLERIYSAPVILNQVMMDEGLANLGDTRRLERAMHKLVTGEQAAHVTCRGSLICFPSDAARCAHAGQPITMVALGGSVTSGTGTFKLENTWVHRVFSWVQRVFPHDKHRC